MLLINTSRKGASCFLCVLQHITIESFPILLVSQSHLPSTRTISHSKIMKFMMEWDWNCEYCDSGGSVYDANDDDDGGGDVLYLCFVSSHIYLIFISTYFV